MSVQIKGGGSLVYDLVIQPPEKHQHLCTRMQGPLNVAKFVSETHKRIDYLIEELLNHSSHALLRTLKSSVIQVSSFLTM